MTPHRQASVIEFPTPLEVRQTRAFEAPIQLVFDVFTKAEHMRRTIAPFGERVTVCEFDLRVGGEYRFAFVTDDGYECSFDGTFLEVEPPTRSVSTWHFAGWPGVEAVEYLDLEEVDGVTTLTSRLVFNDQAGRDHMTKYDGLEANFDNVATYLQSLLESEAASSSS